MPTAATNVTWKVGDVFYRFIDAGDLMVVSRFDVVSVGKEYTALRSKRSARREKNSNFLREFSRTKKGSVKLHIDRLRKNALDQKSASKRSDEQADEYEKYLETVKEEGEL